MSIESELLLIKGKKKLLLAEDALEWAEKNEDSDLHKSLEWDDTKAAREHRLWQVRRLISIHVSFEADGGRRMVSLTIDRVKPGGGYRDINDVLKSRSLYDIMLKDALMELDRLRLKYERIKELEPVWEAADEVGKEKGKTKGKEKEVA